MQVGYRHIDTAAAYGNEREVGEGIRRSGIDRDDVFIETKVWVTDYGYDQTLHALEKATGKLGVDTLDLLILHQPAPDRFDKTIAAYKALETLLADGRVRAIGVSNFMPHHLERLLGETDVVPAVNQVELHPYFTQPDVQAADAEHGILTQAWSPIGGITFYPGWGDERRSVMEDPTIADIATGARQDPRAGHAPLAPAAGPLRDPEVDQPGTHRGELRRLRLRTQRRRTRRHRRARHRRAQRTGPRRAPRRALRPGHPRSLSPRRQGEPSWTTARSDAPASRSARCASAR